MAVVVVLIITTTVTVIVIVVLLRNRRRHNSTGSQKYVLANAHKHFVIILHIPVQRSNAGYS